MVHIKKIKKERKVNFVPLRKREYVRMKYFEAGERSQYDTQ